MQVRWRVVFATTAFVMIAHGTHQAHAQAPDPRTVPFPTLDYDDPTKSVRVRARFETADAVRVESAVVIRDRPHAHVGAPPLLLVQVVDTEDNLVEELNAWTPRWQFVETETGDERLDVRDNVVGDFVFRFRANVAAMALTDYTSGALLGTFDLLPTTHGFCRTRARSRNVRTLRTAPPSVLRALHPASNAPERRRRPRSMVAPHMIPIATRSSFTPGPGHLPSRVRRDPVQRSPSPALAHFP